MMKTLITQKLKQYGVIIVGVVFSVSLFTTGILLAQGSTEEIGTQLNNVCNSDDPDDKVACDRIKNGIRWYYKDVIACQTATGDRGLEGALVGSEIEEQVWNFLVSKGLTSEQAAGVMGNIESESGFDPGAIEHGSGAGFGLAQWTGGRRTNLENAAAAAGKSPGDLAFQLQFLYDELGSRNLWYAPYPSQGSTEWEVLTKQSTVADAVVMFHHEFEVSYLINFDIPGYTNPFNDRNYPDARTAVIAERGGVATPNGKRGAQFFFDTYGGGSNCGISGNVVSPLTLETLNLSSKFGPRPRPCNTCSDWHVGLDMTSGDRKVYSIMDGEVISANKDGGNNIVQIKHSDGLISHYFHMWKDDILVNTGDIVTAGQQIGLTGNSGDSVGEHLHIELDITRVNDASKYGEYTKNAGGFSPPGARIDPLEFFQKNISGFPGS